MNEKIEGKAIPLGRANVDTDLIIPARHLKTLRREGLGAHAFEALRADPGNVFDDPRFVGAPILVAGDNFGCGSSREHAAWALLELGIRAVVAPGFSDISAGNAFRNGIVTVALAADEVERLLAVAAAGLTVTVDLEDQQVTTEAGDAFGFAFDGFRRQCLLLGLDEIGLTLEREREIAEYERRTPLLGWAVPPPGEARRRVGLRFGGTA
jgi:3-isopropylmalate/(R)-2-methylmalate dehydratase small subunit